MTTSLRPDAPSSDYIVIAGHSFPLNQKAAEHWEPVFRHFPLHSQFLLIAKTRIEGKWACYGTPVPGIRHDQEIYLWERDGNKVGETIARAAFPEFADLPYAR